MNELISRQDAIDALTRMMISIPTSGGKDLMGDLNRIRAEDISVIKRLPSALPEVVRCRECKHYQFADNRAFGMPVKMCDWFGFEDVDDDDFCSKAERRTDESD